MLVLSNNNMSRLGSNPANISTLSHYISKKENRYKSKPCKRNRVSKKQTKSQVVQVHELAEENRTRKSKDKNLEKQSRRELKKLEKSSTSSKSSEQISSHSTNKLSKNNLKFLRAKQKELHYKLLIKP